MSTWADIVETGIGGDGVEFRLVIEGAPYEPCTTAEMAGECYERPSLLGAPGTETWTTAGGVSVTTGESDPVGGTDAVELEDDSAIAHEVTYPGSQTYESGASVLCELWIGSTQSRFCRLGVAYDGTPAAEFDFNPDTGESAITSGAFRMIDAVEAVTGWWRVRFEHAGATATAVRLLVYPSVGSTWQTADVSTTGVLYVYGPAIRLADGRRRVGGLLREGLGFSEMAYLAGATIDVGINPIRLIETPGPTDLDAATEMFTAIGDAAGWLNDTVEVVDTSATLHSTAGLAAGDLYHLATEVIRIVSVDSATVATIERGQWRTTAQRHTDEGTDATPRIRALRTAPSTWVGRRCWLYAHGSSELGVDSDGTIVWRGMLTSEPQLESGDATTWTLGIQSRWSALAQEIASGLDEPRELAGAYYPGEYAFTMWVRRSDDAVLGGSTTEAEKVQLAGFFRTNQDFVDALCAELNGNATIASWGFVFSGQDRDGQWELLVTIGSPAYYPEIYGGGPVDGYFQFGLLTDPSRPEEVRTVVTGGTYYAGWSDTTAIGRFAGWSPPPVPRSEMRRIPRTIGPASNGWAVHDDPAEVTANPGWVVYLASLQGISVGTEVTVSQFEGENFPIAAIGSYSSFTVTAVDSATGRVSGAANRPIAILASGGFGQEVKAALRYGTLGNMADFRDALILAAPESANDGSTPFVVSDDIADWSDAIDEAAERLPHALRFREYVYQTGVRLDDVLEHEARLYGVFFALDSDFKIGVRALSVDTQDVPASHTIADDGGDIITSRGFGGLTSGAEGQVNVVELHLGYDPAEDEHAGGVLRGRSVEGVSEARKERILDIKPKSRSFGEGSPRAPRFNATDVRTIADPILTLFGGKILHYSVSVPMRYFGVLVGDTVLLSSNVLPYAGARAANSAVGGMRSARALVVGREWDLAEGVGTLTLLATGVETRGYAPTARVASATGAGTAWTLAVEANRYAPAGTADASYFVAGDEIQIIEWDATTPVTRTGSVDTVSGNDIAVTLDSSWAGLGGAAYNLTLADADAASAARHTQFVWVAGSTLRIDDGGSGLQARSFAA